MSTAPPTCTVQHPQLGLVTGLKSSPTLNQYLGIQYATIPGRFQDPVLASVKNPVATKYGPSALQGSGNCQGEQVMIQHTLEIPAEVDHLSELECLNLNVFVPSNNGEKELKNLPVLVFCHGGSFILGSSSWPQYSLAPIVELAAKAGSPIIAVSYNYRLALFGMLTSTELSAKGMTGNGPLKDSILAFEWVQKYIQGFGGDPNNITALGESAGSCTLSALLNNETRLFDKVINMSGELPLLQPLPLHVHDEFFKQVETKLEIQGLPSIDEKLKVLTEMNAHEFLQKTAGIPALLNLSPFFKATSMAGITAADPVLPGKRHWCKKAIKGYATGDGQIFSFILGSKPAGQLAATFLEYVATHCGDLPDLVRAVEVSVPIKASDSDEVALSYLCPFLGKIMFQNPAVLATGGWPASTPVYGYRFDLRNPWDGPSKGKANHVFDVVTLLQTYAKELPAEIVAAGEQFTERIVKFMSNEDAEDNPWRLYTGEDSLYTVKVGDEATVKGDYDGLLSAKDWDLWYNKLSPYVFM